MYDYIKPHCHNASTYGLWGYVDNTLPSCCYASPWSCVCIGIFLKLLRSPTVASEPGLCVEVICMSRTQRSCGHGYIHIACGHSLLGKRLAAARVLCSLVAWVDTYYLPSLVDSWLGEIVGWSGRDRHYAYAYVRLVLPMCFAHRWLVGVCFSNFSRTECGYAQSLRRLKQH